MRGDHAGEPVAERRACWPSSSGTAERTVTGIRRFCRRSQIARASRDDRPEQAEPAVAVEHPEEPEDQARRPGPRTTSIEDPVLLGGRDRAARPASRRTGDSA